MLCLAYDRAMIGRGPGMKACTDDVQPLEPASPSVPSRPDFTMQDALQDGLLDTTASESNLASDSRIITSGGSVSNIMDTGDGH